MSPSYPLRLNVPEYSVQCARSSGAKGSGAGQGEQRAGSPLQPKKPSQLLQRLWCVLGIPTGPSLPTLYLRHLSGISHPRAEAPGSEGSGQALFPLDWSDRSRGASSVPSEVAVWGWHVPRAPWEPRDGPMCQGKRGRSPGAAEVRAEDLTKGIQGGFKHKIQVSKGRGQSLKKRLQRVCRRCKSCAPVTCVQMCPVPHSRLVSPGTVSVAGRSCFPHRKMWTLLLPCSSSLAPW